MVQMGTVDDHMKNRVHVTQSHNSKITQCNNNNNKKMFHLNVLMVLL